jgi:putative ABC transport system permease protein
MPPARCGCIECARRFSALGIVCGVVSFVAMISLSNGAREQTLGQIEQLGLRNVMVRGAA